MENDMHNYNIDLHTHTLSSDHAYSTIVENIHYAKEHEIAMIACTDHGPDLEDGAHPWHFHNLKVLPRVCEGVAVLRGIEANILENGEVDVPSRALPILDIILAGFHPCTKPMDTARHTMAYKKVIDDGIVDVLTHPGDVRYVCDYEEVLVYAKEHNVAIEINSSSDINTRMGSTENCHKIARLAGKIGNIISLGSDAHICYYIANFESIRDILLDGNIKEEQIINRSPKAVLDFLESRGHKRIEELRTFFKC